MFCQPFTLPFILLEDINILEKKYRNYKLDDTLDIVPFYGYVWKK